MPEIDPELERLLRAVEHAHARFLRLKNFTDPVVVQSALELWQAAAADLAAYRGQTKPNS